MPNVNITLQGTIQNIMYPVIYKIVDDIQDITNMSKDTKIFLPNSDGKLPSPNTTLDSTDQRYPVFENNKISFIEVEEEIEPETVATIAVNTPEHQYVFYDNDTYTSITPIYSPTNITINFRNRFTSKIDALRWRDNVRIKAARLRDINLHSIKYHYPLPMEYLFLLTEIHKLRETTEPYNESFSDYLSRYSTSRLTTISDVVGKDKIFVITETQSRIVGSFNFEGVPEKPERESDSGTWNISFSYKFTFEKPVGCNMVYPIMIHNNLLPEQYVKFVDSEYDTSLIKGYRSYSLNALSIFEKDTEIDIYRNENRKYRIPEFDDFVPKEVFKGTDTIFTALTQLDNSNKKALFNLNELDTINIDPIWLKWIKESEYLYMGKLYSSVLGVSLYINNFMAPTNILTIDSSLNISSKKDLSLRFNNRIRFFIVTDLELLDPDALKRYKKFLIDNGLSDENTITDNERWNKVQFNTVMNTGIVTLKIDDIDEELVKRQDGFYKKG